MAFKPSKAFRELARWAKYQAELCELEENQHVCLAVPPEESPQISTYDFDPAINADIGVPTSGSVGGGDYCFRHNFSVLAEKRPCPMCNGAVGNLDNTTLVLVPDGETK